VAPVEGKAGGKKGEGQEERSGRGKEGEEEGGGGGEEGGRRGRRRVGEGEEKMKGM